MKTKHIGLRLLSFSAIRCILLAHAAWNRQSTYQHHPMKLDTPFPFCQTDEKATPLCIWHGELNGLEKKLMTRRSAILSIAISSGGTLSSLVFNPLDSAYAYTPDSDKLRESLYLISRVQEATVQQERFVNNAKKSNLPQKELQQKMNLSLKLVDRSYRLLDQINFASNYVEPKDDLIGASEAGNKAVEELQSAIDSVSNDLNENGPLTDDQQNLLVSAFTNTRTELFTFLKYMPSKKVEEARLRVEDENVKNREEFSGSSDAGVFNPVPLPWK